MPTEHSPNDPAHILAQAHRHAFISDDKPLIRDSRAIADIELICRSPNRSGVRFLMSCLVAKLSDPNFDVRKPFKSLGGNDSYSGRYYDEVYVGPFASKHELPINPTSSFLTPTFRTANTIITPDVQLSGRPKELYASIVVLITNIHNGMLKADIVLAEVIRCLLVIHKENKKRVETLLTSFKAPESGMLVPAQGAEFYSCFISYSNRDREFAEQLHTDLLKIGVRCWFAPKNLKIGDRFRDKIDESIRLYDKLLLILSENSVSSAWVGDEVEAAFDRENKEGCTILFPIQIDEAITASVKAWAATIRRTRHIGDFTRWKEHDSYLSAFERLLRDLKAEVASRH